MLSPERGRDDSAVGDRRDRDDFQRLDRRAGRGRQGPCQRERCFALRRGVVGDADLGDRGRVLRRKPDGGDCDRAGSAVQRGARVIAQHRAPQRAMAARAHHQQVRVLLLSLLVQPASGARRHDADELPLRHPPAVRSSSSSFSDASRSSAHHAGDDRVGRVQLGRDARWRASAFHRGR